MGLYEDFGKFVNEFLIKPVSFRFNHWLWVIGFHINSPSWRTKVNANDYYNSAPPEIRKDEFFKTLWLERSKGLPERIDDVEEAKKYIKNIVESAQITDIKELSGMFMHSLFLEPLEKPPLDTEFDVEKYPELKNAYNSMYEYLGTNIAFSMIPNIASIVSELVSLGQIDQAGHLMQNIYFNLGLNWMTWTILSELISSSITSPMRRYYNRRHRPEHFTLTQLEELKIRKIITKEEWEEQLKFLGYRDIYIKHLEEMSYRELPYSTILDLYLQKYISEDDFKNRLEKMGYKLSDIELLLKLHSEEKVEEPRKLYLSRIRKAFAVGLLSEDGYRDYLKQLNFEDDEIELEVSLSKLENEMEDKELSASELEKMFIENIIDEHTFNKELLVLEYSDVSARRKIELAKKKMLPRYKTISISVLKNLYLQGVLTDDELRRKLINAGYKNEDADSIIKYVERMKITKKKVPSLSVLSSAVRDEIITTDEYKQKLKELGYTEDDINMITRYTFNTEQKTYKTMTKRDVLKAYKKDKITKEQALDRLSYLGYSYEDAEMLLDIEKEV